MAKQSARVAELEGKLKKSRQLNAILGFVCAFLLVVLVAQLAISSNTGSTNVSQRKAPDGYDLRDPDDTMAIGEADAPVVMTWWTDMRCPFCGVFSRDRLGELKSEYVDTGELRIVVRDAPFFGPESERGAVAARAAGEQGKMFEFLTTVYDAAPRNGKPDLPIDRLVAYAKASGVADLDQFRTDLDNPQIAKAVYASAASARQLGVTSVPYFTIDDQSLAGAQSTAAFRRMIESAAGQAGTN